MKLLALTFLFLMIAGWTSTALGQSKSYLKTRSLLLKMDSAHLDANFKTLFEQAERRKADLMYALYDDTQEVNLNAQVVMRTLADPEMLDAIGKWVEYRKKFGKDYWYPNVQQAPENKYLEDGPDSAQLVLKTLYPGQKDISARVVAYNKDLNTAVVEVIAGQILTEGWHVAVRRENGRWLVLSNNSAWLS
jgi:hypothetical protein